MKAVLGLKLILVRHGETKLNMDGRVQGIGDAPLNENGRGQAQAAARALNWSLPFALYTSPVARALETARIISDSLDVSLEPLDGLQEADAGELEGLTGAEMRLRHPEFMRLWDKDSATAQMPGGESMVDVQERAWRAVGKLVESHRNGSVVVVSHNFTIRSIICRVLNIPLGISRRLTLDLGAITRLDIREDRSWVVSVNENGHLCSSAGKLARD